MSVIIVTIGLVFGAYLYQPLWFDSGPYTYVSSHEALADCEKAKMDKLLKLREDDSSYQILFEKRKAELEDVYKDQMKKVEKLILPLLYNLMKNPENEYIKWPGRTTIVQKQINKIVAITRGV